VPVGSAREAAVQPGHGAARVLALLGSAMEVDASAGLVPVLRHLIECTTQALDARYGAFAAENGRHGVQGTGWFVTAGVAEGEVRARRTGAQDGRTLLRRLLDDAAPPPGTPDGACLQAPVRVRGELFGRLCVTLRRDGSAFGADDEALLAALAAAAGVTVENAQLYEQERNRPRWLEANAQITASLLSGAAESAVLELVLEQARRILAADLGALAVPVDDGKALRVEQASGLGADSHRGLVVPLDGSFMGAAATAGRPITSVDIARDRRITTGPPRWSGLGPAVAVPMGAHNGVRGVLLLARTAPMEAFTEAQTAPLLAYAGQAAVAMELADRRHSAEQIALLEDRDRIARDLHDLAIQRLFATGITLQSAVRFVDHPVAGERLLRAVDDLDETIKIIRTTIFGLRRRTSAPGVRGLRVRVAQTVEEAVSALGFTPALRMEGLLDTGVPAAVADQVVPVLAEALANVARHARAGHAKIALVVRHKSLVLAVEDDGVGMHGGGRRSGLANLEQRARALGGDLLLEPGRAGGTRLRWSVPLPPA
jgi:two-component system, NarL family, sensor histidine kinase DevS